ncbi:hypothetical protein Sj15T_09990 [Sphingobium sp. TA15]|uniref:Uncharacterized protein n=1 Tax=Sphingobium indicum (strain DSM 16413 / CCM 7287 / MTCC 6362 / UT26 / NBRC 101211 / UT26S) TaxID=452662 RepID=D4Z8S0_SPHIU|nr:hypothetical protein [Sphingobium indicum]BAI99002.1 hypothetical protein SJA_P1-00500 [Sphingobium indicum UT26S]BDD65978.1 hypothetical protein Sj15T_09990 [Sphingobium sp. TA15]
MNIELRKLKLNRQLSEETNCYSAEIWIDGVRAFLAGNHGHGGADHYRQVGTLSEQEVDAWLKANRPKILIADVELDHSLEIEVSDLIAEHQQVAALRRKARTHLLTIEDGQIFSRPLKGRDPDAFAVHLRRTKPDLVVIQEQGDDGFKRAARLLIGAARVKEGRGR